jgi:hypothetical protein
LKTVYGVLGSISRRGCAWVVGLGVGVQVHLHLLDRLVPLGATRDAEVLIEQRAVETLDEAVRLRPADARGAAGRARTGADPAGRRTRGRCPRAPWMPSRSSSSATRCGPCVGHSRQCARIACSTSSLTRFGCGLLAPGSCLQSPPTLQPQGPPEQLVDRKQPPPLNAPFRMLQLPRRRGPAGEGQPSTAEPRLPPRPPQLASPLPIPDGEELVLWLCGVLAPSRLGAVRSGLLLWRPRRGDVQHGHDPIIPPARLHTRPAEPSPRSPCSTLRAEGVRLGRSRLQLPEHGRP